MTDINKYREGLVCLVPSPDSEYSITSHEKTLFDGQVLEIFAALDAALMREEKLVSTLRVVGGMAVNCTNGKKEYEGDGYGYILKKVSSTLAENQALRNQKDEA
jgi:hypothetical protein